MQKTLKLYNQFLLILKVYKSLIAIGPITLTVKTLIQTRVLKLKAVDRDAVLQSQQMAYTRWDQWAMTRRGVGSALLSKYNLICCVWEVVPSNPKHNKQHISQAMKYLYSDMCSNFYKQIYYVHSKPSTFSHSTTTI